MKEEIIKYLNEFKVGTKTMFNEFFKKDTNKKQRANMWTFTRLVIPVLTLITSIIAITTSLTPLFILSGVIAGFGAVTDFFDGKSARKHNSSSEYGKILDQASDKFFAGVIGINLLFLNFNYIFILLGEALIATINILYKTKNKNLVINSTMAGKIKEWPLFITLALGYLSTINPILFTISNISIVLTNLFQIVTAASYIKNNEEAIETLKKQEIKNIIQEFCDDEEIHTKEKTNILNNKNVSRIVQCENLRKLKEQLISNESNTFEEEKGFQKTKK